MPLPHLSTRMQRILYPFPSHSSIHITFVPALFIPVLILAEERQCSFCHPLFLISQVANSYTQCTKYNYTSRKKKTKDPNIQPCISSSILSLFVSLIYSWLSNFIFFLLHVLHLLLSFIQSLDYKEYRHIVQTSVPVSSSKQKTSTKQRKETWKPHLLHKALQMQCLLAMLQLFCATANASLELTCFGAEILLSGTSTFCESQCTLGGEHRALSLMQVKKKKVIQTRSSI